MAEFFHMGGYAPYIWSSYGLALIILVGLLMASLIRLRGREATLRALEQGLPSRRRRRDHGGVDGNFTPLMALGGDNHPSGKSNGVKGGADDDAGDSGGGDAGGGDGGGGE